MSSGHLANFASMLIILCFLGILIYFRLTENRPHRDHLQVSDNKYTISSMIEYVKSAMNDLTTSNLEQLGLSEEEYHRRMNQRIHLRQALKGCAMGDLQHKNFVKNTIFDLLLKTYGINEANINRTLSFDQPKALTSAEKFDILLYLFKKKVGYDAIQALFEKHALAELPTSSMSEDADESYRITAARIDEVFLDEYIPLTFEDKLLIIVQRIYQDYKGFSVIDELRDMHIDGVSGGVSGVPVHNMEPWDEMCHFAGSINRTKFPQNYDSVWLLYKGKPVHLEFLSFGSEAALKRVCQNIYRYNHPGQLSETRGYIVNEMKDHARVVVMRPGFAESWAFFVRKFDIGKADLEHYVPQDIRGREILIQTIRYLVRGGRVTAVTGAQGSGKTTLLMAMAGEMYKTHTLRVHEMAFELHLRKIFPKWNVLTVKETESITGQDGLDTLKKTDGTAYMLGEIAQDAVVPWMIQMAQQADTFFSHHAKSFQALVKYLRNSLLKMRIFTNEVIAEEQIVSVLNFDIHLVRMRGGLRYVERITECIPIFDREDEAVASFKDIKDPVERTVAFMDSFMKLNKSLVSRKTFAERNIVEYANGQYVARNRISERNYDGIMNKLTEADQMKFKRFIEETWG